MTKFKNKFLYISLIEKFILLFDAVLIVIPHHSRYIIILNFFLPLLAPIKTRENSNSKEIPFLAKCAYKIVLRDFL